MILWEFPYPLVLSKFIIFLFRAADSFLKLAIQQYMTQVVCLSSDKLDPDICQSRNYSTETENQLQSDSGLYLTYYRLLVNGPTIVLGVCFGTWSDTNGRRGIMIITGISWLSSIALYRLSVSITAFQMELILIGACLQGLFGNDSVQRMAAKSYATDLSSEETRSSEISMTIGADFLGQLAGTLLSAVMFYFDDTNVMLYIDFCLLLLAIVCVVCFLPESIASSTNASDHSRLKGENGLKNANICNEIRDQMVGMIVLLTPKSGSKKHYIIWVIISIVLINQSCRIADWDIGLLYVKRKTFMWSNSEYSFLLCIESIGQAFFTMILVPVLSRAYKITDITFLFVAAPFLVFRYVWAGFMNESWMVYATVIIGTVAATMNTSIRSLLSKTAGAENCGKAFAFITLAETISKLVGAVLFLNIYRATVNFLPGFVFLMEALVNCVMTIMLGVLWCLLKPTEYPDECVSLVKDMANNDSKASDSKTRETCIGDESYKSIKSDE